MKFLQDYYLLTEASQEHTGQKSLFLIEAKRHRELLSVLKKLDTQKSKNTSCTVLLLSHSSLLRWQSIPCHRRMLDFTTLICMNVSSFSKEKQISNIISNEHTSQNVTNVFLCKGGTFLSSLVVCNQKTDCPLGDDEKVCNCTESINETNSCNDAKIGHQCLCDVLHNARRNVSCGFILPFNVTHIELSAFFKTQFNCSSDEIKCQYTLEESSVQNMLQHCSNGSHLEACNEHNCEHSHTFKCPLYYCVPWRYVCNERWDCPWGHDEEGCFEEFKIGFYKCHQSSTHIHLENVCNGFRDCPKKDDEKYCYLHKRVCPANCTCFGFVVRCFLFPPSEFMKSAAHFKCAYLVVRDTGIDHVNSSGLSCFFEVEVFDFRYNAIQDVRFQKDGSFARHSAQMILLSVNCISKLYYMFVSVFHNIKTISLSNNLIADIECQAFSFKHEINMIDLAFNHLTKLERCMFQSLLKVRALNLSQNDIHTFEHVEIIGDNVIHVFSSSYVLCCAVNHVSCTTKPPWPHSCENMVDGLGLKCVLWIIGLLGVGFNLLSIVKDSVTIAGDKDESFSLLLLPVSVSDLVLASVLVMIVSVDRYFGETYIMKDFKWRSHPFCHTIAALAFLSNIFSVESLVIMAVVRCSVIKNHWIQS